MKINQNIFRSDLEKTFMLQMLNVQFRNNIDQYNDD